MNVPNLCVPLSLGEGTGWVLLGPGACPKFPVAGRAAEAPTASAPALFPSIQLFPEKRGPRGGPATLRQVDYSWGSRTSSLCTQ